MGIISWIVVGAVIGLLTNRRLGGQFPGGLPGMLAGGATGAFLGGATFSVLLHRGVEQPEAASLLAALLGAALLLLLVRKAGSPEPHTG